MRLFAPYQICRLSRKQYMRYDFCLEMDNFSAIFIDFELISGEYQGKNMIWGEGYPKNDPPCCIAALLKNAPAGYFRGTFQAGFLWRSLVLSSKGLVHPSPFKRRLMGRSENQVPPGKVFQTLSKLVNEWR